MTLDRIGLEALRPVGHDLRRPECVLCCADGSIYVSDWDGGICHVRADGSQQRLLARNHGVDLRPNGIALLADGTFLLANLGDDGGIWRLHSNGDLQPFLIEIDGTPLPPSNFVLADANDRVWITVSTRQQPRANAYRPGTRDGFIAVVDKHGARIVTDALGYTNEVQMHPSGRWLYVNETFARRTSRMAIHEDGSLGERQTVTEYGAGTFPDGLYFAENGGFYTVSLVSNRVIYVDGDLGQHVLIEDVDPAHLCHVETAFQSGTMGRSHLDTIVSERLRSTSSIAFGGPDRRLSYLGCLLDDHVLCFAAPFAGVEPVHWNWRLR